MSNEQLFQQASAELTGVLDTKETRRDFERALAGDGNGVINVPGRPLFIYARLQGDPSRLVSAFNPFLALAEDVPIILLKKYDRNRVVGYEVQGISSDVLWAGYTPVTYPPHAHSHEIDGSGTGGWDAVNVYERMFTSLRVNAQIAPDLTVQVAPGYYNIDDTELYFVGGNSPAMTAPVSGVKYAVVCIDAAGVISIEDGALTGPPITFTFSTTGLIPLAAVLLIAGQTSIVESDILDVRPFLSLSTATPFSLTVKDIDGTPTVTGVTTIRVTNGTLTDDGGGVVTITITSAPHNLLDGSVNQDTVAHTVVLGDLIYGNATPKWQALAGQITTTRKFLRQTGTGAISAVPAWDTLMAADLPNTAVTPGTYGDAANVGQFTVDAQGRITAAVDVPITATGGHVIQDEGTPLTQRANLDFVGSGVTATDDAGDDASVVTIPAWSILANGDPAAPEVVFSAGGDVIAVPF